MFRDSAYKPLALWLMIGIIMVFVQVIIGGITRLTDSGLSITEWKIVEGTLPPLNQTEWDKTFDNYKVHAKKQYEALHPNMDLAQFKVIYFWEYFHRLWARSMAMVFVIGFTFFLLARKISKNLLGQLLLVIALASLEGLFGWIMVSSGLNEDSRTWVSAYKLIIHLMIATLLFSYLCWTFISYTTKETMQFSISKKTKQLAWSLLPVALLQILLGGLMAGMRAGVVLPYFPIWLHLDRVILGLNQTFVWNTENLLNYEPSVYIKMMVQLLHRATALLLTVQVILLYLLLKKTEISLTMKKGSLTLLALIFVQLILGVLTVIGCNNKTPVVLGVMHQATALVFLASLVFVLFKVKTSPSR